MDHLNSLTCVFPIVRSNCSVCLKTPNHKVRYSSRDTPTSCVVFIPNETNCVTSVEVKVIVGNTQAN